MEDANGNRTFTYTDGANCPPRVVGSDPQILTANFMRLLERGYRIRQWRFGEYYMFSPIPGQDPERVPQGVNPQLVATYARMSADADLRSRHA